MSRTPRSAFLAVAIGLGLVPLAVRAEEPVAEQATDEPVGETADELMKRLEGELRAAQKAYYDSYMEAVEKARKEADDGGSAAAMPAYDMGAAVKPFVPQFADAAQRFAGTDDAVPFLVWVALNGRGQESGKAALDRLISSHLESPAIARFVQSLPYFESEIGKTGVWTNLDAVIERNPSADVKALALIARGELRRATDADLARTDLLRAAEVALDAKIAGRARGILTEMEQLQLGMTAPDIAGQDLDGVAFKLSDYRGKVVVLDFWGDW